MTREELLSKVRNRNARNGDCMEVGTASKQPLYWIYKHDGKCQRAHRISWQLFHGPIPDGMKVLHSCDNPRCVNPHHLFLGTSKDNSQDMLRKGRAPKSDGKRKLAEAQVVEIIHDHDSKISDLADRYGVSIVTICEIRTGKTWKHIPRPQSVAA